MKKVAHKLLTSPKISNLLRRLVENNFKKQKEFIISNLVVKQGDKILDLGCGTGELCGLFPKEIYLGLDPDEICIEHAKNMYGYNFIVGDGRKLPFIDNYFSKILVVGVFHHLSHEESSEVLREIRRVLKVGGKFLVMEDTISKNFITEFIHYFDQGKYIRSEEHWEEMFGNFFNINKQLTFKSGLMYYSCFLLDN